MWNASCEVRCLKSTSPPPEALSSPICGSPDIVIVYAARAVPASAVAAADSAISAVSVVGAGPVGGFAAACPQPAASAAPRIRVASRRGDTHSTYTPLAASAIPQSGGRRCLSDEPAALGRLGGRLDRGGRGDLADLPAVLLDVALVVVLGRPEGRCRDDLGHDLLAEVGLGGVTRRLRGLALLLGVVEDRGAVLRADVPALAVPRRRVVDAPEEREQLLVRHDVGVERDVDRLGVARAPRADLLVGRVLDGAAGVAGHGVAHALDLTERVLDTPETARSERGLHHQVDHLLEGFLEL